MKHIESLKELCQNWKTLPVRVLDSKERFLYKYISIFCLIFEVIICYFILTKGKYTEIDWSTYMQQVEIYNSGEYNYTKISGDTGPCVYPSGFLRIFSILSSLTDSGRNIFKGQAKFNYIMDKIIHINSNANSLRLFNTNEKIVFSLLFSNFIGISFSRSLHYQFYVWYYHSINYLVFSGIKKNTSIFSLTFITRSLLLLVIEYCWCTFPATFISSILLQLSHFLIYCIVINDRWY